MGAGAIGLMKTFLKEAGWSGGGKGMTKEDVEVAKRQIRLFHQDDEGKILFVFKPL